jgi:hypothetical protein
MRFVGIFGRAIHHENKRTAENGRKTHNVLYGICAKKRLPFVWWLPIFRAIPHNRPPAIKRPIHCQWHQFGLYITQNAKTRKTPQIIPFAHEPLISVYNRFVEWKRPQRRFSA